MEGQLPNLESEGDVALVTRAKAGDPQAFEALANRYERQVYSLAWRMLRQEQDAEDVTQQTFLSVLENLQGFRGESSFATWLMRIATYAALKVIRKRRQWETARDESTADSPEDYRQVPHPDYIADWRESPERLVDRRETRQLIDDALGQLEEKHRLVFLLRDLEGLSIQEAAQALGLSESNVKVRLLRARLQLREILTRAFGNPQRRLERSRHSHEGGS
jgi:RNA polymerase sigma-70 factor, ECF subfamily